MSASIQDELLQRYLVLQRSCDAGQIDQRQFYNQVKQLQMRDEAGTWWAVDPRDGAFLRYDGREWLPDAPPVSVSAPAQVEPQAEPDFDKMIALMSVVIPLITAACWMSWSWLVPSEQNDCITPLIVGGIPLLFIYFRRPIDRLLLPIQPLRRLFPKLILYGVSLALPLVLAYVSASMTLSGFGVPRFVALVSLLAGYALIRDPEVRP